MIIKFIKEINDEQFDNFVSWLEKKGIESFEIKGYDCRSIGLFGNVSKISIDMLKSMDIVSDACFAKEPYKMASRQFNPKDKIIRLENGLEIGGNNFTMIAGPCSVENEEQILKIAKSVKKSGANILRGGAFKPRTSPYTFQGIGFEGLKLLEIAKKETGLPIISEIMDVRHVEYFENVDILQVGARNMQNFELLKELGRTKKPVLIKRGLSATYKELLLSAEHVLSQGNENVILCERGIRTFETGTRNTFDVSAIPYLHEKTNLPVIADPSHATGLSRFVPPIALSAVSAGANGLMVEVHNNPKFALSDGEQSLNLDEFEELSKKAFGLKKFIDNM